MLGWIIVLALLLSSFLLWRTFCLISDEHPVAALFRFVPGLVFLLAMLDAFLRGDLTGTANAEVSAALVLGIGTPLYFAIGFWFFARYAHEMRVSRTVLKTH